MLRAMRVSLSKQSSVIVLIAVAYALSLLTGMAAAQWGPEAVTSWITADDTARNEALEEMFGGFRDAVRDGELGAMAAAALLIFAINTLVCVVRSVSSVLILPLAFLLFSGWFIGVNLHGVQGSSSLSVFLFLMMAGLEWVFYVLSAAAGTHIGLAVLWPQRLECPSRGAAFKRALAQSGMLYVAILAILAVQAAFEILYVRKVLMMGGTGVPLAPW